VDESAVLARMRALLLVTMVIGVVGLGLELLLLGHVESTSQILPVVLLGLSLVVLAWHAAAPGVGTVRALQATMMLLVVTGGIGVGLHYDGNVEFELEMYPSLGGLELIGKTLTGATPVFAPGSMTLLGLVGLALVYRHPALEKQT
jgi:hypothetical protein